MRFIHHLRYWPKLQGVFLRKKFANEWALYNCKDIVCSDHPSIILFTAMKAASQSVAKNIAGCCEVNGMKTIRWNHFAFNTSHEFLHRLPPEDVAKYVHIFRPQGFFYGPFNGLVSPIPEIEKYKVILSLRDPRDILVSMYFSIANSHVSPGDKKKYDRLMKSRKFAQYNSIDSFVKERVIDARNIFTAYMDECSGKPNVHLVKFEEMISDFPTWLRGILDFCELDVSEQRFAELCQEQENSRPSGKEAKNKHLRKGVAGDFKDKLQAETIEYLNSELEDVLQHFGYHV